MHGKAYPVTHHGHGVLAGLPNPFHATRYHSLIIDEATLPPELAVTARTDGITMAVSHRTRPIEGVQFHPESILTTHGSTIIAGFVPPPPPARRQASPAPGPSGSRASAFPLTRPALTATIQPSKGSAAEPKGPPRSPRKDTRIVGSAQALPTIHYPRSALAQAAGSEGMIG